MSNCCHLSMRTVVVVVVDIAVVVGVVNNFHNLLVDQCDDFRNHCVVVDDAGVDSDDFVADVVVVVVHNYYAVHRVIVVAH